MSIFAARRDLRPVYVSCDRSGVIVIGEDRPRRGSLTLFRFSDCLTALRGKQLISARARHGWGKDETLLVPGVPEATSQDEAMDYLCEWVDRITPDLIRALPAGRLTTYRNQHAG